MNTFTESPKYIEGSLIEIYRLFFEKEKILYNTLNMFSEEQGSFKGLCWCPLSKIDNANKAIGEIRSSNKIICSNLLKVTNHNLTPPTYFRCNEFLRPFQDIVYTYGVPSYREANPTLFTIITFPYLFGIMFGDFAHGTVLFCLSAYICLKKDYLIKTKSALADAVDFRYLLLMMGFFSAFAGLLYNDFAAVPLNFITTCFDRETEPGSGFFNRTVKSCVNPIGFDPKWYSSVNELQFVNSFKMKISVVVGVTHMTLGIILKGLNALNETKWIDFLFEFLPQLIFMIAFFGYMNFMIIIKWLTDWSFASQNGPSIITLLIGIPLRGSDPGPIPLYGTDQGKTQQYIGQMVLCKLF